MTIQYLLRESEWPIAELSPYMCQVLEQASIRRGHRGAVLLGQRCMRRQRSREKPRGHSPQRSARQHDDQQEQGLTLVCMKLRGRRWSDLSAQPRSARPRLSGRMTFASNSQVVAYRCTGNCEHNIQDMIHSVYTSSTAGERSWMVGNARRL